MGIRKVWLKKVGGNEQLKKMYDEKGVKKAKKCEKEKKFVALI